MTDIEMVQKQGDAPIWVLYLILSLIFIFFGLALLVNGYFFSYIPRPPFESLWPYLWLGFGLILGGFFAHLVWWEFCTRKQEGLATPMLWWMKEIAFCIGVAAGFGWIPMQAVYGTAALGAVLAPSEPVTRCYEVIRPWDGRSGRLGTDSGRLRTLAADGDGVEFAFGFRHGNFSVPRVVIAGEVVCLSGRESWFGMIVERVERAEAPGPVPPG
jgi:hypothetical protein